MTRAKVLNTLPFFFVALTLIATRSRAGSDDYSAGRVDGNGFIKGRCNSDWTADLNMARGRNDWALKCNYINGYEYGLYTPMGSYVTFVDVVAPFDGSAPCMQASRIAFCELGHGCYLPDQHVNINDVPSTMQDVVALAVGAEARLPRIRALSRDWIGDFPASMKNVDLDHIRIGDEIRPIYVIRVADGHVIKVTHQHPLVTGDLQMIAAEDVVPGETVLSMESGTSRAISVETQDYVGLVWNMMPDTAHPLENVHVAEGFLSGSLRFQDEWERDDMRRQLRSSIDPGAFVASDGSHDACGAVR